MKYFITGITGTLGKAVTNILLEDPHSEVVGYSRDELKQSEFLKSSRVTLYLGDVRDKKRLIEASRGCDLIFHFAALKHVDMLEKNPEEAISTNVFGTMNVLHAQRVNHIRRLVLSSTDKACYPINVYGASKSMAEKLVLRNPNNVVCRYGNVIASRGSAIPKFIETLSQEHKIYLTHEDMTRFWIPIQQAAGFVYSASKGEGGLRIPQMKALSVVKIAEVLNFHLSDKPYEKVVTGIRAGEKIHECLRMAHEGEEVFSHSASQYKFEEIAPFLESILREVCP